MTYTLTIWYAATGVDDEPQTYTGVTAEKIEQFVRPESGFMRDLLTLEGRGVRKLCVEIEPQ